MFGRSGCHLCEEMAPRCARLGVEFEEIDVDSDPRLDELYGARRSGAAAQDGKELCRHRLTPEAIAKLS